MLVLCCVQSVTPVSKAVAVDGFPLKALPVKTSALDAHSGFESMSLSVQSTAQSLCPRCCGENWAENYIPAVVLNCS